MFIYLFVFFISITATFFAQICLRHRYRVAFFIFSLIAILMPSLLAGFRDSGVGTDTEVYVNHLWNVISDIDTFTEFMQAYEYKDFQATEFVYLILNFGVSRFTDEVGAIYFFTNFIVVLLVYCTAYDNRNRASMWFIMYVFLFMYYNASYNLVRQSLALFMVVYSFKYIEQKRWILAIIWTVIILKTHNTGVFYLLLVGIYFLFSLKNIVIRNLILVFTFSFIPLLLVMMNPLILLMVHLGLFPDKFLMYLSTDLNEFNFKSIFCLNLIFFFILWFISMKKISDLNLKFYAYSKLVGTVLLLSSILSQWAYRISYYFNCSVDCVFLPRALFLLKNKSQLKYRLILFICMVLFFFAWLYFTIYLNQNETYPYRSKILGIA